MRALSIIGGFIATMVYIAWYNHVFNFWPNVNGLYSDLTNIIIYAAFSICFFALGSSEKDSINKWFVFYSIGEFWGALVFVMIYNQFIYDTVIYHKTLVALNIVLCLNFIVGLIFLIKWWRK